MNEISVISESSESVNIYIDGSCIHNGSPHAIAGYGVYFGTDDERNEYARVVGKQTNNTGELTAFIRAVEKMQDELVANTTKSKTRINIYTDSEYVMKCAGAYGDKLFKNDWKTTAGKVPPNLNLIQRIREIYRPYKKQIALHHVKAHTGLSDEHSVGNAEADRLANLAVGVIVSLASPQDYHTDRLDNTLISNIKEIPVSNKNYINIGFDYKDSVKKLGAKWDTSCKKWYYEDNITETNKNAILEIEKKSESDVEVHTKVYVKKVPFCKNDELKKLGCRFDPEKKLWYYMSNHDKKKIEGIKKLEALSL
jgi:ribonuclease HI